MQLDSFRSTQDPSSIHPNNNDSNSNSATSSCAQDSSDLNCDSLVVVAAAAAFEPSLQPLVLDTFILSSSPGSPTPSSACSSSSSCSDISSTSTLVADLSPLGRSSFSCKNEGTAFAVAAAAPPCNKKSNNNIKESMLFALLPNDSEPLDLQKQPCLPLHLHFFQEEQQEEQQEQEECLVPLATAASSPSLTSASSSLSPTPTVSSPPKVPNDSVASSYCSTPSSPAPTFVANSSSLLNHCYPHHPTSSIASENEQSEPEFDRDSISITNNSNCDSDSGNTNSNSSNSNCFDTMESPLTVHHPHIVYSTVPAATTTLSPSSSAKITTAITKTTRTSAEGAAASTTSESQSETLDLDLGPTTQGTLFSAQLDPLLLDNMANITPLTQDHLHLQGEINFDKSHDPHPHGQRTTSSLSECNGQLDAGCGMSKEDGLRFKDPIEALVRGMGRERKRSTGAIYDGTSSDRKRRKNQPDWGLKQNSSTITTTSTETAAHLLRFLEKRFEQRCPASTSSCSASKQANKALFKQKTSLDFDPFLLLNTWSSPSPQGVAVFQSTTRSSSSSSPSQRRRFAGLRQPYHNSLDCRRQHASPEKCQCRKRIFADAIELPRPFTMSAEIASHHPNWVESVKKRKIHQNATKWTSALSPAPYVRLLGLRNFWEMMEPRQDLSWKSEDDTRFGQDDEGKNESEGMQGQSKTKKESLEMDIEIDGTLKAARQQSARRRNSEPSCVRTVKQYPCPGHFLRGLWEEELRNQRVRQMIPDTVRKPIRGKIYHAKPIMNMNKQNKPSLPRLLTGSSSTSNSSSTEGAAAGQDSNMDDTNVEASEATQVTTSAATSTATTTPMTEFELSLKKKHRAAAIIRSHAITEGSDMSEYKPWKDGTVTPRQGSLQGLKASRSNIMDPWPVEEAKSKDECMRVLHRMREQLNIVINLQIHLRSMMKSAPGQWSFLLSIRHPGQVSIELLLALYGPHFMQTSNFRAIEELLWGAKGHSQQAAATASSSIDAASSSSPALVQT